ncbi:major facilitator superfamily MFS_1 [Beutenbergia cavernae DSM 12333]|uniref:Major facilitator superfamily MFS_1 n=1 Tax=Beutenbergia cavernae (strain ATCC BAA-8 / DSM 12333 / CCUG 43141 / JCM 11478 / NBRC 16432 / NCIMB 13614 / HKI 0122) TaxID=471853 RepID=C5BXU7_BEUC1|nr:MFS transporter [Beutenbergia cavernae]ACQ78841.1 major facilitator superfamily MFS_1 [Beutenbergia cavernae DSM 12333]
MHPASETMPRATRTTRWWVVALLFFLGWLFIYADRTILNPVMSEIGSEFGLDKAGLGLLNSVFFLVYALVQVPSGMLGDKYGRLKFIVFGFIVFGLFTGLTGIAGAVGVLFLMRAMAGFGQGFYYGPQYSLSGEMIPERFRTVGSALINSGQAFGISIGLIASSYIAFDLDLGWRGPFYVFALPTIVVGLAMWVFIKEPARPTPSAGDEPKPTVLSLFKSKNLVRTFVMVFCSIYGFFVMITWLPTYLNEVRGVALEDTGFVSSLAAWTSVPAALVFAYFSDRIGRRKPLLLIVFPAAIASILLLVFAPSMPLVIVALVLYGLTGKLATDPLLIALCGVNSPKAITATAFGLFNFIGMSASILAPYITGFLVEATGEWNVGFYLAIGLLVVAILAALGIKENRKAVS